MAFQAFMSIRAAKQGQFKGEVVGIKGREDWIHVLSFSMGLNSPIDVATGQSSGKRQWQQVGIVKEWGAASPQALTACVTNEKLTEVKIEFSHTDRSGQAVVHQAVKLADAIITGVDRHTAGGGASATSASPADTEEVERWSFTFNKIEVTDTQSKTSFKDDWQSPV